MTTIIAIGSILAVVLAALWKASSLGRQAEAGKAQEQRADDNEAELDRIGRAANASRDVLTGRVPERPDDPYRRD